ncbi:MAG: hypothetical protein Q9217_006922 [Psora testacea]
MPTYRSITLSLISQYDILTIPEYAPPTFPNDPFTAAPTLVDTDHSLVSVYIPTYPSSQFWLSYSISPPHPPKLLYYFKLYINGQEIVSWGCGEHDEYKGKTMFGLYDTGLTMGKKPVLEQRVLCFAQAETYGDHAPGSLSDVMEIKVFRSKGRERVVPEPKSFEEPSSGPGDGNQHASREIIASRGIDLVNAGILPRKHPQRFYRYALLDPLDRPFATFRYYYRSWDQLEALGVISRTSSEESSSIRSHETQQQPVRLRSSHNSLGSPKTPPSALENASPTAAAIAGLNYDRPTRNSSRETNSHATNHRNSIFNPPASVDSDDDPLDFSPLRVPRPLTRTTIIRPPTPPTSSSPKKPPPSTHHLPSGSTLSSKDQFTSLIRTHLPNPDPDSFKLKELYALRPVTPTSSAPRKGSINVLQKVVDHAVRRRKSGV